MDITCLAHVSKATKTFEFPHFAFSCTRKKKTKNIKSYAFTLKQYAQ